MFKRMFMLFGLMLCSFGASAEFNYVGKGNLVYPTGMKKPFNFGFTYKKADYGHKFKIGKQEMDVEQLPSKYTIWINLHQEKNVFVQEFAKGYFEAFEWQLGEHTITLRKKVFKKKRAKGDYVLNIDGEQYFFKKTNGQINILFNDKGIRAIEAEGFVKDIGMKD